MRLLDSVPAIQKFSGSPPLPRPAKLHADKGHYRTRKSGVYLGDRTLPHRDGPRPPPLRPARRRSPPPPPRGYRAGRRAGAATVRRVLHRRNPQPPHTRKAYTRAAGRFLAWCDGRGLALEQLEPFLVAAYVEELAAASVKQHPAALRMLLDSLVVGQVLPANPAHAVRGPKLVVRTGKSPVLQDDEPRILLDSIQGDTLVDLRDKAFLSVLLYSFSRVSAVVGLKVRDYEHQRRRAYLALHEKGGQHSRVPRPQPGGRGLGRLLAAAGPRRDSGGAALPGIRRPDRP